jgi:hypothetical protein
MNKYIGNELELFKFAHNWKKYFCSYIIPYLKGNIIEIGAGIGATTKFLNKSSSIKNWYCYEPDITLLDQIKVQINSKNLPLNTACVSDASTLDYINVNTIIYVDVLEHIENDEIELINLYKKMQKDAYLIILVPAFNFLFNEFDLSIGHYRRYNKKSLKLILPKEFKILRFQYLDSLGFFMSLANRLIFNEKHPKLYQIKFWDKVLIPISKVLDKLLFFSFGKSLLLIVKK